MDRDFLSKMSKSFINDHALLEHGIWDSREHVEYELNQYLISFMTDVRYEDVAIYQELHDMNRQRQYELTYIFLEDFINSEYPDNDIFQFEESLGDVLIREDFGFGAGLTAALAPMVAFWLGKAFSENLTAKRLVNKSFLALFKFSEKIHNGIKKLTAAARAKDAIIFSSNLKCNNQCNIGSASYQTPMNAGITKPLNGNASKRQPEADKQFDCMFKCFIRFNLQIGNSLFTQYQQCSGFKSDRNIQLYLTQPENSTMQCKTIYEEMVKHFDLFKSAIDDIPKESLPEYDKQMVISAYFKGESALKNTKFNKGK